MTNKTSMNVRILLADDHKIVRDGLRALIEKQPGMEVVAEAMDGLRTVQLARRHQPDVIIMDITMPRLNGIKATLQLTSEKLPSKVIALSMHSDRRFVDEVLKAGASGYLLKDCAFEELADAIRAVMAGGAYLSRQIETLMSDNGARRRSRKRDASLQATLTDRERQVLRYLAEGKSTRQTAAALHLSPKTVETHRQHCMEKLGIRSAAELTKYAVREGLVSLET
jgi:two-component system response regulator NreC